MPSISLPAIIGGVSSVASLGQGALAASASGSAAKKQSDAATAAAALQARTAQQNADRTQAATNQSYGLESGAIADTRNQQEQAIQRALQAEQQGQSGAQTALTQGTAAGANALTAGLPPALAALQGGVNSAVGTDMGMYGQTRADLAPYLSTGTAALNQLANLWGIGTPGAGGASSTTGALDALTKSTGYQFGMNQGVQALDRSAASRGLALSGAQLQDAQTFGQGYAAQNALQPYIAGLTGLASSGQNAGNTLASTGVSLGTNAANAQLQGGTQAAGLTAQNAQALATLLQGGGTNLANLLMQGGAQTAGTNLTGAQMLGGTTLGGAQSLAQLLMGNAGSINNLMTGGANDQATGINNSAAASAAGTVGSANAINSGISGALSNGTLAYMLGQNGGKTQTSSYGDIASPTYALGANPSMLSGPLNTTLPNFTMS